MSGSSFFITCLSQEALHDFFLQHLVLALCDPGFPLAARLQPRGLRVPWTPFERWVGLVGQAVDGSYPFDRCLPGNRDPLIFHRDSPRKTVTKGWFFVARLVYRRDPEGIQRVSSNFLIAKSAISVLVKLVMGLLKGSPIGVVAPLFTVLVNFHSGW